MFRRSALPIFAFLAVFLPNCAEPVQQTGDVWAGWELKLAKDDPDVVFPPIDQVNLVFALVVAEVERLYGPQFDEIANSASSVTFTSKVFMCGDIRAVGCTSGSAMTVLWDPLRDCLLLSSLAHEIIHVAQRVVDQVVDGEHADPTWWGVGGIEGRVYERLKMLKPAFCS